jgi:hypothetical protein
LRLAAHLFVSYARVTLSSAGAVVGALARGEERTAIVFFRITNTSARNAIVEQLLKKTHDTKYDTYWHGQAGASVQRRIPGLFALIQQLDNRRNEIVHWHSRSSSSSTGERWDDLAPAYYWARAPHLPPRTWGLSASVAKLDVSKIAVK